MNRSSTRREILLVALASLLFVGADFTRFLGPQATGNASDSAAPLRWSATENVVWKTALPGFGASSPITVGDKIFVTSYSGYGLDQDEPGDQEKLQHNLVCIDRAKGDILWAVGVKPRLPRTEYRGFVALHGYASGTPTTDGQAVYCFFGSSGVAAFSLEGEPLWRADVGSGTHNWGSGASPILFDNLLIVNASIEGQSIVALDKATGQEVWSFPGIERSWSTPVIVEAPGGGAELVVSMQGKALGLNPATGEQLWECTSVDDYVCPSAIAHEGIVYVTAGRKPLCMAVRAGGRGDVTNTHVLWQAGKTPKVATPLYYQRHLYWIDQKGVATCLKADTGEVVYQERLEIEGRGDKVYASLAYADGKLLGVTRQDGTIVLPAKPEFQELARNDLGDSSVFNATAVPDGNRLLIRSNRYLYCIGQ